MTPLLTCAEIQTVTQGRWLTPPANPGQTCLGAAFDSRKLEGAELFFTLPGGRDAHEFLPGLAGSGIKVALVSKEVAPLAGIALLLVADVLAALHQLARFQAARFPGKIISLTGSSGKTTAKGWLHHLLSPLRPTQASQGSFNNHIGCPVTLLGVKPATEILILEMGTNGHGELELLSSIAPADVSLLLNVGHAHVGKFGGLAQTYQAKMEIFRHLRPPGLAVLPAWDAEIQRLAQGLPQVGFGPGGDFWCEVLEQLPTGQRLRLHHPGGTKEFICNQVGPHVPFTLAALAAVMQALGLLDRWPAQLDLPLEKGRANLVELDSGALLLDDSYNANPESIVNMLQTLVALPGDRRVAVIGNLGELEADLGQSAEVILAGLPSEIDHLFFMGDTGAILTPLAEARFPELDVRFYQALPQLIEDVKALERPGCIIGIKASRTAHLERLRLALQGVGVTCFLPRCPLLMNCGGCEQLTAD